MYDYIYTYIHTIALLYMPYSNIDTRFPNDASILWSRFLRFASYCGFVLPYGFDKLKEGMFAIQYKCIKLILE